MENCEKMFSKYVLTDDKLRKLMKRKDFKKFMELKHSLKDLNFELADVVARAIKKWALSLGATHYTHWFFPLTGKYAEKQVSFLDMGENGEFINKFNGNSLIKGETDASSFPSGGERMTFEARGYTVWDYSSPVFIKEDNDKNKVLYIPTAFCSYTGVALDEKTPLLRATEFLNFQTTKLLNTLGYSDVKYVDCNMGGEQEYFLIDKNLYKKRKDLVVTGRTLLGSGLIKKQEMYNHYFGQINSKISSFMHELDKELWAVGIMAKIQHNEVAPSQHEVVPVYSSVNIATDQNSLMMDIMQQVADRHNLQVLFHEKPFNCLNGSGKHNNWSISTNTGLNLLDFNHVKEDVFMIILTSIISAIDKHYDLLRMSVSSLSNDFRLGGYEAPPSIISVFVGDDMLNIMENYVTTNKISKRNKSILDMKTKSVAKLYKDNCDRNRTSPFAYTGNKFEFRMAGSSQSMALCNAVLATIIADEIKNVNAVLEKSTNIEKDLRTIICDNIKNHKKIIFNGNSYDKSWQEEAKKRGLIDYRNCVDACSSLKTEKAIKLFTENGVMSETEINIRYNTYLKTYCEGIITEAKTLLNMIEKQVIPSLNNYLIYILNLLDKQKINRLENKNNVEISANINNCINSLYEKLNELNVLLESIEKIENIKEKSEFARDKILDIMFKIREIYDGIENIIPDEFKPFPSYNELVLY